MGRYGILDFMIPSFPCLPVKADPLARSRKGKVTLRGCLLADGGDVPSIIVGDLLTVGRGT